MKTTLLTAAVLALAACGGGDRGAETAADTAAVAPTPMTADTAMMSQDTGMMHSDTAMARDTTAR